MGVPRRLITCLQPQLVKSNPPAVILNRDTTFHFEVHKGIVLYRCRDFIFADSEHDLTKAIKRHRRRGAGIIHVEALIEAETENNRVVIPVGVPVVLHIMLLSFSRGGEGKVDILKYSFASLPLDHVY